MRLLSFSILSLLLFIVGVSCSSPTSSGGAGEENKTSLSSEEEKDPLKNKGIGPIKNVDISAEIDQELVQKGSDTYKKFCSACHKPEEKYIGPAPKGILQRRTPEWIMNMILNPEEMVQKDPIAKKLLREFNGSPMANQNLSESQARAILEYFRTL